MAQDSGHSWNGYTALGIPSIAKIPLTRSGGNFNSHPNYSTAILPFLSAFLSVAFINSCRSDGDSDG